MGAGRACTAEIVLWKPLTLRSFGSGERRRNLRMTLTALFRCFCSLQSGGKTAALQKDYDVTGAEGAEALITPVGAAGNAIQRMT
jgi:hypothetical protein